MIILNNSQTKKLEDYAVKNGSFEHARLMENAGAAVCRFINDLIGSANKSIAVVCGIGNNGGDGFVVAKRLLEGGAKVRVLLALGDGIGTPGQRGGLRAGRMRIRRHQNPFLHR